jgi:hypothetical protein
MWLARTHKFGIFFNGTNVSILLAWLSAAGKEVVLLLVTQNTLYKKFFFNGSRGYQKVKKNSS